MKMKILIDGMSCGKCVAHVREALEEVPGVIVDEVNLEGKYAIVETTTTDEMLIEAIEDAGYDVVRIEKL